MRKRKPKKCTCCVSRVNVFKFMTARRNRVVVISKMFYVACVNGMSIYFSYFCHLNSCAFAYLFFCVFQNKKRTIYNAHCVRAEAASPTNRMCHAIQPFYISCACTHIQTHTQNQNSFRDFPRLSRWISKENISCAFLILILVFGWVQSEKKSHPQRFTHQSAIWLVYKRIASNYSHFADIVAHSYELIAFAFFYDWSTATENTYKKTDADNLKQFHDED